MDVSTNDSNRGNRAQGYAARHATNQNSATIYFGLTVVVVGSPALYLASLQGRALILWILAFGSVLLLH